MASKLKYQTSSDIAAFGVLTSTYCLSSISSSQVFHSGLEVGLDDSIPIYQTSIGGINIIGRLAVGNKNGLLLPVNTTDNELKAIRNALPDEVKVERIEEKLNALGNCVVCNDYSAIIHPELDDETENIIADTLGVKVYRKAIGNQFLVGTYFAMNNVGGIVHPKTTIEEQQELADLLDIKICAGTVNRGSNCLGSGILVNDWVCFVGYDTTAPEMRVIENVFDIKQKKGDDKDKELTELSKTIMEAYA